MQCRREIGGGLKKENAALLHWAVARSDPDRASFRVRGSWARKLRTVDLRRVDYWLRAHPWAGCGTFPLGIVLSYHPKSGY